ncbi:MAG: glycoside hydrolase family 172 protein [Angelakisella sp.]
MSFNGLTMGMGNLALLSNAVTRSISPENYTGEKGKGGTCQLEDGFAKKAARDLGIGWKVNPFIVIDPGATFTIADIAGSGCIQHIWLTPTGKWRNTILRAYWDERDDPSIECPIGDFFASGWGEFGQISSLAVCVNPGSAFNCYWPMPFREHCRMTLENRSDAPVTMFYQIDYTLTEVPADAAYFHAQFRRVNPLPYKEDYVIIDNLKGRGHYVGTAMSWGVNNNGWWGEGEIKFFIDGDKQYPTICGTGTEDYFCGSYDFEDMKTHLYQPFTTPYTGLNLVTTQDNVYRSQLRFGMYRWHIMDPIRFSEDLRVTIQALGWREGGKYLPLQDDIASVAFWYQEGVAQKFPALPDRDYLEII